ncbi:MAG: DUF1501 domain-containing protein [Planctomycetes bacterium]|nr:DUF1501 domain-containing protein [Planctomycetota bacterium]
MFTIPAGLSRRDALRLTAAGVSASSLTGWLPVLAAREGEAKAQAKAKACIVLWMDGGPPHTDTFDMKPDVPECGIYKAISTAVPGISISELLPKFSQQMQHAAIVRGMSTIENEHLRARVHLRTGYRSGQGGLTYPSMGSIASEAIGVPDFPIPNYVAVADVRDRSHGPGFLGPRYQPLFVHDPKKGVESLKAMVSTPTVDARIGLLQELDKGFAGEYQVPLSTAHRSVYDRAVQLMRTEKAKAFDLSLEPMKTRSAYGESAFGQGCLLARRLVETGVKYIEVGLGGWDTHFENNEAVKKLCGTLDHSMTALIADLQNRGLLDSTLVIWMGEFGRTPTFKGKGRDHFAKAWSTVFMGGGVKGGQVIGRTDKTGATVAERPVSTADFFATVCRLLGIDHEQEKDTPGGRPLPRVEKGGVPVQELFS